MRKITSLLLLTSALCSASAFAQSPPSAGGNNSAADTSASSGAQSDNPLVFTSKAQLLQRKRLLGLLRLKSLSQQDTSVLADSLLATLRGDYNLTAWDTTRVMQNGVPVVKFSSVCRTELETHVRNLFDTTLEAYRSTWSNEGPAFQRGDLAGAKSRIDNTANQLLAAQDSWCSTVARKPHPYQTILPKLLGEFDEAIATALDESRTRLRAEYQKKQAEAAVVAKAEEDARAAAEKKQQAQAAVVAKAHEETKTQSDKRQATLQNVRENKAELTTTPDMCVDGMCLEQDIGMIPAKLSWSAPYKTTMTAHQYKTQYLSFMSHCAEGNQAIWGSKVNALCDLLVKSDSLPSDIIAFFRANKLPVCNLSRLPRQLVFESNPRSSGGFIYVRFGNDGRPKIKQIHKELKLPVSEDVTQLRSDIKKKHPYLQWDRSDTTGARASAETAWGGRVHYSDVQQEGKAFYELSARNAVFVSDNESPIEGGCKPVSNRKATSIQ